MSRSQVNVRIDPILKKKADFVFKKKKMSPSQFIESAYKNIVREYIEKEMEKELTDEN